MKYPGPLLPGRTIGVTAPSSGVDASCHSRLDLAMRHLTDQGYRVREGRCLRGGSGHVSAPAADRAAEFMEFWGDPEIAAIIPPWGGELLIGLLPLLDWDRIAAAEPTWLLGYSDISTVLFPLTVRTGIATAHGTCLMEQIPGQSDPLVRNCLRPLGSRPGESFVQTSSTMFELKGIRYEHEPERGFVQTESTHWKTLGTDPDARVAMRGRIIGGCLDVLARLVGTPFGNLPEFIRRHQADGVILYLENCELSPAEAFRSLHQMRLAGWFDGIAGLVVGRTRAPDESGAGGLTQRSVIEQVVGGLGCPVIFDADLGHVPPQMTIINGAMAEVTCEHGAARLVQTLAG